MSRFVEFDGRTLCEAVRNTFMRRLMRFPNGLPMAFTDEFQKDTHKQAQWRAFVRKSRPEAVAGEIDAVIRDVAAFLMPVVEAARTDSHFEMVWPPSGPWR